MSNTGSDTKRVDTIYRPATVTTWVMGDIISADYRRTDPAQPWVDLPLTTIIHRSSQNPPRTINLQWKGINSVQIYRHNTVAFKKVIDTK